MSKSKIVKQHDRALAALRQLALPTEASQILVRLQAEFAAMRQLHSSVARQAEAAKERAERAEHDAEEQRQAAARASEDLEKAVVLLGRRIRGLQQEMVDLTHLVKERLMVPRPYTRDWSEIEAAVLAQYPPENASTELGEAVNFVYRTVHDGMSRQWQAYQEHLEMLNDLLLRAVLQHGPLIL